MSENAYVSHLMNLQEKTKVIASEDIISDRGMIVVKSGTQLSQKICDNIANFKLLKPLEDSIFIENQLTSKSVFEEVISYFKEDKYLLEIHKQFGDARVLQKCCMQLDKYPILLQKLTVLRMEITHVYQQSLISAYMACLCGIIEKMAHEKIEEQFLAGILHDIGLLHIDRYIITKSETLSAEEWRKVQSHPLIGFEILKRTPNFPSTVARAVMEHHENLDGSGYPRGKTLHDLENISQLINLLDNTIVIYNKKLKPLKRSLKDVIPIMQMTMDSYVPKVVSNIFKLLHGLPSSPVKATEREILSELIKYVQAQQAYINSIIHQIIVTNKDIGLTHNIKDLLAVQNIAINIMTILNSTGLNDDANLNWQQHIEAGEDESQIFLEVQNSHLMQEEMIFQLGRYQKSANVYISQNPDKKFSISLQKALDIFSSSKRPAPAKSLQDYWTQLDKG